MGQKRRDFLKSLAVIGGVSMINLPALADNLVKGSRSAAGGKMKLTWKPYELQLKHAFNISTYSRKTTPVVLTTIEYDGLVGYGEASLPPYLGETQASVIEFLKKWIFPGSPIRWNSKKLFITSTPSQKTIPLQKLRWILRCMILPEK